MQIPEPFRRLLNLENISDKYRNIVINYILEILSALNFYLNKFPLDGILKSAVSHLIGKGKLIRPLLSLLISRGLGVKNERSLRLAVAIEFGHTASLIHDDIIDRSDFRRGTVSVHKQYGEELAILAGDALILMSNYIASELSGEIIREILHAGIKMCMGESLELENQSINIDDYLDIVYFKTASYFEHIARASAMLAGIDRKSLQIFGEFGKELGYAFQFRDDVLDIIGDKSILGKPVNHDVNKPNLVKILCKENNINIDEALKIANQMISQKIDNAIKILEQLPLNNEAKNILKYLLISLKSREI